MRPTGRVEALLGAALLCALGGLIFPDVPGATAVAWSIVAVVLIGAAIDALSVRRKTPLRATRQVPGSIAIGRSVEVELALDNAGAAVELDLFDHVPPLLEVDGMPRHLELGAKSTTRLQYSVKAIRRGSAVFEFIEVHMPGPLGLFVIRRMIPCGTVVRVLPDFQAVRGFEFLAVAGRQSSIGIRRRQRRGQGLDFHQLRDWREGDSLRQVDWKATSRRGRVISKEYQEERDQRVVFLLDTSRRMRATAGDSSHFDQVLNAVLLLSAVAVRQGDEVGLYSFGGESSWSPPRKGPGAQTAILQHVVDLNPTLAPADYAKAATELLVRVPKRSLIVLATNLRGEDAEELEPALALLRKRHLVLIANLREDAVERLASRSPRDLGEAQATAAAMIDRADRRRLMQRLRGKGVFGIDVEPRDLPVALVNGYLDIKAAGSL